MACNFLNLNSCEVRGATYQGRRIDFVNKDISQDVFTAKAYDKNGYLVSEFTGLKSGSVVYFPFTTLQNIQSDKFIIKYWANFPQLGNIQIANEELIISNDCKSCKPDNKAIPYTLKLINETVKFTLSFVYIAIGSNGDVDLTEYLKKTEADNYYQPKGNYANSNHAHNDLTKIDASNIPQTSIPQWRNKLGIENFSNPFEIGSIATTNNSITLNVNQSGFNYVSFDGNVFSKTTPDNWSYTPVTFGTKIIKIYALPDAQIFYITEGVEDIEAVEPQIPNNSIPISTIIVSTENETIETPDLTKYAKKDASNIDDYIETWKAKLGFGDIDTSTLMLIADYVVNGKIRADKIESLALLDLITAVETTLADFAAASANYVFQKNDLVALPDGSGKYSFYIYTGGIKTDVASYLAMGISGVTISQVANLQSALDNLQSQITANNTAIVTKQDKSMFSSLVDKWIHFYDATTQKMQPILQFVSGVVNQLEFTGRIKADAIVLPNDANPVVAGRFRRDGADYYGADDNAVERKFKMIGDSSMSLVHRYTHSSNVVLLPTAVDYTTGYITVDNHGLSFSGQQRCGIFRRGVVVADNNSIVDLNAKMPDEYIAANLYLKVIDANTLMVCNSGGGLISVNTSGTYNTDLDVNFWQVEIFSPASFDFPEIVADNFIVLINGYASSAQKEFIVRNNSVTTESFYFYSLAPAPSNRRNNLATQIFVNLIKSGKWKAIYGTENIRYRYTSNNNWVTVQSITPYYINFNTFNSATVNSFYSASGGGINKPFHFCNGSVIEIFKNS